MSDDKAFEMLCSSEELVVVEAPAGCGKTYQGAGYANFASEQIDRGRILILTHTHAACAVFAGRTNKNRKKVEIRTIDSFVVTIASVYHNAIGLPQDVAGWANNAGSGGFAAVACKVFGFLNRKPKIASVIATWYPIIICDEHQDTSLDQHSIVMALHRHGSQVRIFGDPMQMIYSTGKQLTTDTQRWDQLKNLGASTKLEIPHRWRDGSTELGEWVQRSRHALLEGRTLDLTDSPGSVRIIQADNEAKRHGDYQLNTKQRWPVDKAIDENDQILVLAAHNDTIRGLNAAFFRRLPIWEGHTRNPLQTLVKGLSGADSAVDVAKLTVKFVDAISVGFTASSHTDRLMQELQEGCVKKTTGKPLLLQNLAKLLISEPSHLGVAAFLSKLRQYINEKQAGFDKIKIDYRHEFADAIRLGQYSTPEDGVAAIRQKRASMRSKPPRRCLSTIHKAKGLECNNAIIMACDGRHFRDDLKSRNLLYVALSRAKNHLTIVISDADPSPIIRI